VFVPLPTPPLCFGLGLCLLTPPLPRQTRIFTTKRAFMLSLLDLALTLTAVVLWAMLM
jgi:hypothetical protein